MASTAQACIAVHSVTAVHFCGLVAAQCAQRPLQGKIAHFVWGLSLLLCVGVIHTHGLLSMKP